MMGRTKYARRPVAVPGGHGNFRRVESCLGGTVKLAENFLCQSAQVCAILPVGSVQRNPIRPQELIFPSVDEVVEAIGRTVPQTLEQLAAQIGQFDSLVGTVRRRLFHFSHFVGFAVCAIGIQCIQRLERVLTFVSRYILAGRPNHITEVIHKGFHVGYIFVAWMTSTLALSQAEQDRVHCLMKQVLACCGIQAEHCEAVAREPLKLVVVGLFHALKQPLYPFVNLRIPFSGFWSFHQRTSLTYF